MYYCGGTTTIDKRSGSFALFALGHLEREGRERGAGTRHAGGESEGRRERVRRKAGAREERRERGKRDGSGG